MIYFKACKNRPLEVEQAVETAVEVCIDRSSGYCQEMICADFLTDPHR
jgi:hypothetical protein